MGCIINDIIDQGWDCQVERTKTRPLAAKSITSCQAILAALFFLSIGLVAWLFLRQSAKYVSLFSIPLMIIYPFMKRCTHWPQFFLGCTFNFGLIVATVHAGAFSWNILVLFLSLILWTIFYDTIYAFADIKDDLKIGVKSTAIVMQNAPKVWLSTCNLLTHILLYIFLDPPVMPEENYYLHQFPYGLTIGSILIAIVGFIYLQTLLIKWRVEDPKNCIQTFSNCHIWSLALWLWFEFIRIISP